MRTKMVPMMVRDYARRHGLLQPDGSVRCDPMLEAAFGRDGIVSKEEMVKAAEKCAMPLRERTLSMRAPVAPVHMDRLRFRRRVLARPVLLLTKWDRKPEQHVPYVNRRYVHLHFAHLFTHLFVVKVCGMAALYKACKR